MPYGESTVMDYCAARGSYCTWKGTALAEACAACGDKGQACCEDDMTPWGACRSPYKCGSGYTCTDATSTSTSTSTAIF